MGDLGFEKQLLLGKLGEEKVFNYLSQLPTTIDCINLSNHKRFQSYGIDGLLISDGEVFMTQFFDVKTDFIYHRTGNIFLEVASDNDRESGILSTKANSFYYYDPFGGELFDLPIFALKNWYRREGISYQHLQKEGRNGSIKTGIPISPFDLQKTIQSINPINIGGLPNHEYVSQ